MGLFSAIKDRAFEGGIGQYCMKILEQEEYGLLMGIMPETRKNLGMDVANAALAFYRKERAFHSDQRPQEETMASLGFAVLSNLDTYSRAQRSAFNRLSKKLDPRKEHTINTLSDIDERLCFLMDEVLARNSFS